MVSNGSGTATAAPKAPTFDLVPAGRRRRLLRTRLASGHLLMIVAGALTFVLVANALRSRDASVQVVVANADKAPGAIVDPGATRGASLPASSSLMTPAELRDGRWVVTRRIAAGEPVLRSAREAGGAERPAGHEHRRPARPRRRWGRRGGRPGGRGGHRRTGRGPTAGMIARFRRRWPHADVELSTVPAYARRH